MLKLFTLRAFALVFSCALILNSCSDDDNGSGPQTPEEGIEVGNRAPDFTLKDKDGNDVSLSSFRGKVVLLEFWRTTCPQCLSEMEHLETLWHDHQDRDFVIVSVHIERDEQSWMDYISATGSSGFPRDWVQLLIDTEAQPNVTSIFRGSGTPKRYLLDKEGVILKDDISGDVLVNTVEDALGI